MAWYCINSFRVMHIKFHISLIPTKNSSSFNISDIVLQFQWKLLVYFPFRFGVWVWPLNMTKCHITCSKHPISGAPSVLLLWERHFQCCDWLHIGVHFECLIFSLWPKDYIQNLDYPLNINEIPPRKLQILWMWSMAMDERHTRLNIPAFIILCTML